MTGPKIRVIIHDMNKDNARSTYTSPLRARQKEQTRDLILAAVGQLLAKADFSAVTIAEVARAAQVTERTIYRHFPTREDLLREFWKVTLQRLSGDLLDNPESLEEMLELTRRLFTMFDAEEGVMRAISASPEGRMIRKGPNEVRLGKVRQFLEPLLEGNSERERENVAAAVFTLCSVSVWIHMRDYCGFDGPRAGEAAAGAIELIVEAARRRGEAASDARRVA
jgi:AcrR family transcriptional regulator